MSERERTRGRILDAAARLLDEGGRDARLSLRAVAREASLAAPSVYWHFASLDEIVDAVVVRHVGDLAEAMARAAAKAPDDPRAQLAARATAYCRWGLAHPGPYTVVIDGAATGQPSPGQRRADHEALIRELAATLPAIVETADARGAALALWTALHGIVALRLAKPTYRWPSLQRQVTRALRIVGP